MNGVQTRFKCKLDVKRCKRFVFPPSSLLPRSNALKTKAIRYFQTDRTLTRIVSPPLKEYRLLEYFMTHQGVALSRITLLKDVWDKNFDTNTNIVDVYVNYLRVKIDRDFDKKLIHTVVGLGYIMNA